MGAKVTLKKIMSVSIKNYFSFTSRSMKRIILLLLALTVLLGILFADHPPQIHNTIVYVYQAGTQVGIYGISPDGREQTNYARSNLLNSWRETIYNYAPVAAKQQTAVYFEKVVPHAPVQMGNGRFLAYKNHHYRQACEQLIRINISQEETSPLPCLSLDAHNETSAWSPDGQYIAFTIYNSNPPTITIVNVENQENTQIYPDAAIRGLAWSPDSDQLAAVIDDESTLHIYHLDGTKTILPTPAPAFGKPTWSPNGQELAYFCYAQEKIDICLSNLNGESTHQITFDAPFPYLKYNLQWSPQSEKLLFDAQQRGGANDIFLVNADGTELQQLTSHPAQDYQPTWSPDGQQIAFVSLRDGNKELYTIRTDGSGLTRITNTVGDETEPTWMP